MEVKKNVEKSVYVDNLNKFDYPVQLANWFQQFSILEVFIKILY